MAKKTFNDIFMQAVDDALSSLGEPAKESIYLHLKSKSGIEKSSIERHLKEFEEGLDRIFGGGAKYIEILIMKNLYKKLNQPLEWNENKNLAFADYVDAARKSYMSTTSKKSGRKVKA